MRVIIATDGSTFSSQAVETYFENFAQADDEIRFITAIEPAAHVTAAPFGVMEGYYRSSMEAARKSAEHVLEQASAICSGHSFQDVKYSSEVLIGSPSEVIVEEASKWNADLIVVGSHGRGFLQRMYLGSVSNAVANHAPCSVLIARKHIAPGL